MPAEPFDVFVRRIAPEHAHLILAEVERLRGERDEAREGLSWCFNTLHELRVVLEMLGGVMIPYAIRRIDETRGEMKSSSFVLLYGAEPVMYGETSPDVAPACGDACGDGG